MPTANLAIEHGGRHAAMVSLAARLRSRGMGEADLTEALVAANVRDCVPPLPVGEIRGIVRWAARRPSGGRRCERLTGRVRPGREDRGLTDSMDGLAARAPCLPSPVADDAEYRATVAAVWEQALGVTADVEVSAWLMSRGIDSATVEDLNLARVLPTGTTLPGWARGPGGRWDRAGYRVLIPVYASAGRMAGLRARYPGTPSAGRPKALAPAGLPVAGRVMACPLARLLLVGAAMGDDRPAAGEVRRVGVVIAEGETDYLAAATWRGEGAEQEDAPAIIGIVSGSWTQDLAARVPDGATVTIATDADDAGDRYAAEIAATLADRCELRRWRSVGEGR